MKMKTIDNLNKNTQKELERLLGRRYREVYDELSSEIAKIKRAAKYDADGNLKNERQIARMIRRVDRLAENIWDEVKKATEEYAKEIMVEQITSRENEPNPINMKPH